MTRPTVTPATRALVLERDERRCVRCGTPVDVSSGRYSLHHRRAKGMGGTKRPESNRAANLVTLCGSATTPGGCHQHVESNRTEALVEGLLVSQHRTPADEPLLTWRGWVLLDNDGGYTTAPTVAEVP